MKPNFSGPPVMKDETQAAIRKMKLGKATGPGSISMDLLEALEDYRIDKITTLFNEIYDTGQIRPDISKSTFIALPKKPRATQYELHRTISFKSQNICKNLHVSQK